MKEIKKFVEKNMGGAIASFAMAFAGLSLWEICFYIFHQPKMPEELAKLNEK